jgi:hypothetical protein
MSYILAFKDTLDFLFSWESMTWINGYLIMYFAIKKAEYRSESVLDSFVYHASLWALFFIPPGGEDLFLVLKWEMLFKLFEHL